MGRVRISRVRKQLKLRRAKLQHAGAGLPWSGTTILCGDGAGGASWQRTSCKLAAARRHHEGDKCAHRDVRGRVVTAPTRRVIALHLEHHTRRHAGESAIAPSTGGSLQLEQGKQPSTCSTRSCPVRCAKISSFRSSQKPHTDQFDQQANARWRRYTRSHAVCLRRLQPCVSCAASERSRTSSTARAPLHPQREYSRPMQIRRSWQRVIMVSAACPRNRLSSLSNGSFYPRSVGRTSINVKPGCRYDVGRPSRLSSSSIHALWRSQLTPARADNRTCSRQLSQGSLSPGRTSSTRSISRSCSRLPAVVATNQGSPRRKHFRLLKAQALRTRTAPWR